MKPKNSNDYYKIFNREYFEDGTISNYDKSYSDPLAKLVFKRRAKKIKRLFNPKKVLDIGCAKGFLIEELQKLGIKAYGVDVSKYATDNAPKNVRPFLQTITPPKLPFKNKSFDLVCSFDVLEHTPENDLDDAIAEYYRVGKKQYHHITTKLRKKDKDITHVTIKPLAWWEKKMPGTILIESKWERVPILYKIWGAYQIGGIKYIIKKLRKKIFL